MVYSFVISLLSLFSIFDASTRKNDKVRYLFSFLCFIVLVLLAGLRWKTANDWDAYHDFYVIADSLEYYSLAYEFGFRALVQICKSVGLNFTGFLIVIASLQMIGFLKFFNRFSYPVVLFLVFFTSYYFSYMGTLRQSVAISFCLIAFVHLLDNKKYFFILWVLLASMFHVSAILFIFVPFVPRNLVKPYYYLLLIAACFVLGKLLLPFSIEMLASISDQGVFLKKVIEYSTTKSELLADQSKLTFVWYFKRLFFIFIFYFVVTMEKKEKEYEYCFNLYFCSLLIFITFFELIPMIALRGGEYFTIFEVVLLTRCFIGWPSYALNFSMLFLLVILSSLRLYNSLYSYSPELFLPYYSVFDKLEATRFLF